MKRLAAAALAALLLPSLGHAQTVDERWVRAHENFLAGEALQGRGSGTRDEAIAASYVAAQFEGFGLKVAPGMNGYVQTAQVIHMKLRGAPQLRFAGGAPVAGVTLFMGSAPQVAGKTLAFNGKDPKRLKGGDVIVSTGSAPVLALYGAAAAKGVKLLIVRDSEETRELYGKLGGKPRLPAYLAGGTARVAPALVAVPAAAFDAFARSGGDVALSLDLAEERGTTSNALGYIQGSDPAAGTVLYSAHLDHLGVQPDGSVMHGANDDASGTVAVIEIARALAAGKQPRRSILFVAYGSEEAGGWGARYFVEHPPVPLSQIVANIEFEMIGAQDPKLPKGQMMMTGFERSDLGQSLKDHGALVGADPYPEQNFFRRSDNYALALKGVVAHTISGWAVVPTYHSVEDTVANIDFGFMTRAIQSLVGPAEWLANADYTPQWKPGGKPD